MSNQARTAVILLQHDVFLLKENQGGENDEQVLDGQETLALMSANGQLRSC